MDRDNKDALQRALEELVEDIQKPSPDGAMMFYRGIWWVKVDGEWQPTDSGEVSD